jgi:hypothetical protein
VNRRPWLTVQDIRKLRRDMDAADRLAETMVAKRVDRAIAAAVGYWARARRMEMIR